MSKTDSRGARWVRAALQVNPYEYHGMNAPAEAYDDEAAYNTALLDECQVLDIEMVAVTDHWRVDSAAGLIADAAARGIVALPGFEANSSEGVHLLVIFETGTEFSAINAAIGACGVTPGCANGTTGLPFKEILAKMSALGALVIPAHVNVANSGMLTGRSGQPLVEMVMDANLHAIAVTPSASEGTDQRAIMSGTKPYDRQHPLAIVYSDDIMRPGQLGAEGATTWFKVTSRRAESLKLAVRTPETRVKVSSPSGTGRAVITSIGWTGGFLDGVTVPFSGDLTALIGGRGAGKSTVIESLRYALDLAPIGKKASTDHAQIVEKVLRSGTVIQVEIDTVSPTPRRFVIERVVPNPPIVKDMSGQATELKPADVLGAVEIFGQHELAELASSPGDVAQMLRRFAGSTERTEGHKATRQALADNRLAIEKAEAAREELRNELADIPRLEEQVKQYAETDVAKRLKDLQRLDRDEATFLEATNRVATAANEISTLTDPRLARDLQASYDLLGESPQIEFLEAVSEATNALAAVLEDLAQQAKAAIEVAGKAIADAKKDWDTHVNEQREGHAEVLRSLHADGLEPDKYLDTAKALDSLTAKQPKLAGYDKTITALQKARVKLLGELAGHERAETEQLHDAVRAANESTGGVVIVRPIAAVDRQEIIDVVTAATSGTRTQMVTAIKEAAFSPRALAGAIRGGVGALEEFNIRGAQAANLVAAGESLCRRLEELTVGHAVEVLLDVAVTSTTRELRKLDDLSKGQKATALLLLLLGASVVPLVIDQPEDDLDNRFVYDGVVANLRRLKGVRQVVASTHNANVPVLGDAELIVTLEGAGTRGQVAASGVGSLDDAAIRRMVEDILEGGAAAFNARQHLYGF